MAHKNTYRVEVYEIDPPREVETVQFDTAADALAYAVVKRTEGYAASPIETLEDGSTCLILE